MFAEKRQYLSLKTTVSFKQNDSIFQAKRQYLLRGTTVSFSHPFGTFRRRRRVRPKSRTVFYFGKDRSRRNNSHDIPI